MDFPRWVRMLDMTVLPTSGFHFVEARAALLSVKQRYDRLLFAAID